MIVTKAIKCPICGKTVNYEFSGYRWRGQCRHCKIIIGIETRNLTNAERKDTITISRVAAS